MSVVHVLSQVCRQRPQGVPHTEKLRSPKLLCVRGTTHPFRRGPKLRAVIVGNELECVVQPTTDALALGMQLASLNLLVDDRKLSL